MDNKVKTLALNYLNSLQDIEFSQSPEYQVMLELLENVLINNMDIKDAVKSEENKDQGYSKFNPNLLYYDGTE